MLVTSERSPLEPQTEHKYYAPGVGEIAERVVKGHHGAPHRRLGKLEVALGVLDRGP
jgi:hypothetical protein